MIRIIRFSLLFLGLFWVGCSVTPRQISNYRPDDDSKWGPAKAPRRPEVLVETSVGNFVIELFPKKAPESVKAFLALVDEGYYNDVIFHRVVKGFVVQAGKFTSALEKKPDRPSLPLEADNGVRNALGTVAMARRSDPNSASTQFFINLAHNYALDATGPGTGYAVFGRVLRGYEVVKRIAGKRVKTESKMGMDDFPVDPVVILKMTKLN